ncbi:gamma-glutamyltransferase [Salipiger sp. PrR002]|uniref:gamma-glutamyltransferase n=1 Tax=Salipiger sp. PrR002 TaxID=2706489 RepID=UPI0013B62DD9|nr:gamma-glutamyltransferase [Salipiger sp. PrR002]NDW01547.1 gamma-glutamyltransferase [Salipiger sp. PrR002]NDW58218.1 gamma-glutamyltransferase [Salipiger sp. PrR004]
MTSENPPLPFVCRKTPARSTQGIVVTNHPLGSVAGHEMLASGGNAVDAAVASLLALTVVEPMMVGIVGGGVAHLRLPNGEHTVYDCLSQAPAAATPDMFQPVSDRLPDYMETAGRRNLVGPSAVAVPGNLQGWCAMQKAHGALPFEDVIAPAIRYAQRGFAVTNYLASNIERHAEDMSKDPEISRIFLPGGTPAKPGHRLVQGDYAESLKLVAKEGAAALHGGALGRALVDRLATGGPDAGLVSMADLEGYTAKERDAIFGSYRGHDIVGPPPPASSGVHVAQMLNILEGFDLAAMGFDSPERLHLLAEAIRIGFEDRRAASGDPDFVDIPVEKLISKAYGEACRDRMLLAGGAGHVPPGYESRNTTHITVADRDGRIVSATHTINGLFGARFMVPGTGMIPNNYMYNFDPHPGKALSIAPGKRVPTSMAPMIVLKDGKPSFALGLPGAVRIFPSAMQAIINMIDFGMTPQQAVEAPRVWTEGAHVELEPAYAHHAEALTAMGHEVRVVPHIGGGMNAIAFGADGEMTGAACWRADGTVSALGGGLAGEGIAFHI